MKFKGITYWETMHPLRRLAWLWVGAPIVTAIYVGPDELYWLVRWALLGLGLYITLKSPRWAQGKRQEAPWLRKLGAGLLGGLGALAATIALTLAVDAAADREGWAHLSRQGHAAGAAGLTLVTLVIAWFPPSPRTMPPPPVHHAGAGGLGPIGRSQGPDIA